MEAAKVGSLTCRELKMAITAGVLPGRKLWDNMLKREVTDLDDFYERAQKYIRVEDGHANLKVGKEEPHAKPPTNDGSNVAKKKRTYDGSRDDQQRKTKRGGDHRPTAYTYYTNLTDTREHIYVTNEDRVPFKKPPPMRKDRSKRDPSRYCQYHKGIEHTTAECIHLKEEIEELIRQGHLGRYVRRERQRPEDEPTAPQA